MSYPYYYANSIEYTPGPTGASGVLAINATYHRLADGATFSVIGMPNTLTFSINEAHGIEQIMTYSISLSASSIYNLTFSALKGPYYEYNEFGFSSSNVSYRIDRVVYNYTLNT